jgi:D-tyrosyl-tRNA(Tyr) deacylase
MRAIIQRVTDSILHIEGEIHCSITSGLLILIGITHDDTQDDIAYLVKKITQMRIFSDSYNKMNLSVMDVKGELMVVSQFTVFASTKKGNRPGFSSAAKPEIAIPLYEEFIQQLIETSKLEVVSGKFGADMKIRFTNDGPVTIIIDSKLPE